MANGFVYILLNPAFPKMVKIGLTKDISENRARKLSAATGVPTAFIVLFDALVSNIQEVEQTLKKQFASCRVNSKREFFYIEPKLAISALIDIAKKYPVSLAYSTATDDLLPFIKSRFSQYLDPNILSIRLVTVPGSCYLRIGRDLNNAEIFSEEELPLSGLQTPTHVTQEVVKHNAKLLATLDEYSWIMVANIFSESVAMEIAKEWERPGGKLEQLRSTQPA